MLAENENTLISESHKSQYSYITFSHSLSILTSSLRLCNLVVLIIGACPRKIKKIFSVVPKKNHPQVWSHKSRLGGRHDVKTMFSLKIHG